jgi:uncharacterized protein YceK
MTRALACAVAACALTGCGTAQNFARMGDGKRPLELYGGTTRSYDTLKATVTDADALALSCTSLRGVGGLGVLALDVPLSAVADTLTLPVTAFATWNRISDSEPPISKEERNYWREFWGVQESRELPVERMP